MVRAIFFQNAVTLGIMVGIAPYLATGGPRVPFYFSYFHLGVTSRGLSMTLICSSRV